jgi:hypothetical protein
LYTEGYTIRGVQKLLREQGPRQLISHHITPKDTAVSSHAVSGNVEQQVSVPAAAFVLPPPAAIAPATTKFDSAKFDPGPVSVLVDKASLLASLQKIRADVARALS